MQFCLRSLKESTSAYKSAFFKAQFNKIIKILKSSSTNTQETIILNSKYRYEFNISSKNIKFWFEGCVKIYFILLKTVAPEKPFKNMHITNITGKLRVKF